MNPIAEKIARRRKELGMTQREMAEKLNVSDKTLSRWETGKQIPDAFTIRDIAKVLNMKVSEIYDEEENEASACCLPEEAEEKSVRKQVSGKKILKIAAAGIVGTLVIIALIVGAANYNLKSKVSYELKNVPIYALTFYDHSVLDWIKACDASGKEIHRLSSLRYDPEAGEDIASYLFYLPHGNQDTEVDVRYRVGMGARTLKLYFKNKTQNADDTYCLCYVELVYDQENFENFRVQTYLDAERIHYGTTGTASFVELCEVLFDVD